jgi:hypothetical protein
MADSLPDILPTPSELTELMNRDLDAFAAEYFRIGRADSDGAPRNERLWSEGLGLSRATSELDDLVHEKPHEAWPLILALLERAPEARDVAFLAAGPIEDFVMMYPRAAADAVAHEAGGNQRLREALNYVWGWDKLPADVAARMLPLLDSEVRNYWTSQRAAAELQQTRGSASKGRWRPPPRRPKSDRFT